MINKYIALKTASAAYYEIETLAEYSLWIYCIDPQTEKYNPYVSSFVHCLMTSMIKCPL